MNYSLVFHYTVARGDVARNLSVASAEAVKLATFGARESALTDNFGAARVPRDNSHALSTTARVSGGLADLSVASLLRLDGRAKPLLEQSSPNLPVLNFESGGIQG